MLSSERFFFLDLSVVPPRLHFSIIDFIFLLSLHAVPFILCVPIARPLQTVYVGEGGAMNS